MIRLGWQLQAKQGRRKQSVDGQAQLDANSSREARGKILNLAIFSSQEAPLLHSRGAR